MENQKPTIDSDLNIQVAVNDILNTIERIREREIIAKRFGLFARKETLEQVGELLNITRERVRQLEKSIIANLKYNPHNRLPHIKLIEEKFTKYLKELGNVARVKDLGAKFSHVNDHIHQAQITFLSHLSPKFVIIKNDNHHHHSLALANIHKDNHDVRHNIDSIVKHIAEVGEPISSQQIHLNLKKFNVKHVHALALISKKLAHLNQHWGLHHWSSVNPKNIRDKIFIVLKETNKPMHFSKIAQSIHDSSFKRNKVSVQAIHNELIKDRRFVLVGRGIYALRQWGYKKGTISDVIYEILKKSGKPMDRYDIVKEVLKKRQVKQTTVLLNLQCKPIFKRLEKTGQYILNE
ncbi:MAG: HTH domain-containing protein [Candidatus Saccharibacteria bacterium]|nr:HTH domain-containing protein [Candidatus Saccharibacteria bacterium]